jgi:hypothetical protein
MYEEKDIYSEFHNTLMTTYERFVKPMQRKWAKDIKGRVAFVYKIS